MSEEKKKDEVQEEVVSVEESTTIERCLTFNAGGLILYISTKYVIEIINNHTITTLPLMPPYIKGIINLRGQILPVVDIQLRMGKPETDYTSKTCIIVLDIDSVPLGIIVDSVRQMIDIDLKDARWHGYDGRRKRLHVGRLQSTCRCTSIIGFLRPPHQGGLLL